MSLTQKDLGLEKVCTTVGELIELLSTICESSAKSDDELKNLTTAALEELCKRSDRRIQIEW